MKWRNEHDRLRDQAYNAKRYAIQREKVCEILGLRCGKCGAFRHARFLDVISKEGSEIPIPPGGRYLRSMRVLREKVVPYATLVCNGGCKVT
jgi:hypothetical protein